MRTFLARWLGMEEASQIESWRLSFGASWAHHAPALVLLLCLGLATFAAWYYLRRPIRGRVSIRGGLAALRALLLGAIVLILAEPLLEVVLVSRMKPTLWLLFDGSESMAIADKLPVDDAARLQAAVNWKDFVAQHPDASLEAPVRADYVRALLAGRRLELLTRLAQDFETEAFVFDGSEEVRGMKLFEGDRPLSEWKTEGPTTALGDALHRLADRHATEHLAGMLIFSDFDQNTGDFPLPAARKLGVPLFTVGVGPLHAADLSIDLLAPPTMKKSEDSTITAAIRQGGAESRTVAVRLSVRRQDAEDAADQEPMLIETRSVSLTGESTNVEFHYTPPAAGRLAFLAEIESVGDDVVLDNNRAERTVRVVDDFLRLLSVEYEPSWEWRFLKEVFHRDKLVGTRGFRTFLRSADPVVRETNELFVTGLTLPRSEFFQFDVLFLGDMPAAALSTRFCEMAQEFVGEFGGGLVVLAGPRFGPGQLASTPLADMLPVVVDPNSQRQDSQEFRLNLTPLAEQFEFMRLGRGDGQEHLQAWNNLGKLPWYQPVLRPAAVSTSVLAEHPTDLCADGVTKQPLIAIRKYGRGEVIYLGFNEFWRLRRFYGEEYYRQFWGQVINRLGLSHALGAHKRFLVRTDKPHYRTGDSVPITVEAYNRNFQPLDDSDLGGRPLKAEVVLRDAEASSENGREVSLASLRPGVFTAEFPPATVGEYLVRVVDPVTHQTAETHFDVSALSLERRSAVRNAALQRLLADETGGRAYDLTDVSRLPDDFSPPRRMEKTVEIFPLWNNWLCFTLVISLMMVEWLGRKLVNLI